MVIDDNDNLVISSSDDEIDLFDFSDNENNVRGRCPVEEFAFPMVTCLVTSSLKEE